jgi:hypothetical protein
LIIVLRIPVNPSGAFSRDSGPVFRPREGWAHSLIRRLEHGLPQPLPPNRTAPSANPEPCSWSPETGAEGGLRFGLGAESAGKCPRFPAARSVKRRGPTGVSPAMALAAPTGYAGASTRLRGEGRCYGLRC